MTSITPRRWSSSDGAALAGLLGLALLLRLAFLSGLSGSDETVYAIRGMETARGLWLPSDYVGDLRYGVNLPIAAFVAIFGTNAIGLHAWALLCSLGEILVVYLTARYLWNTRAAALAAFAMAITPLHVHAGGRALADAPLALFITLSFSTFLAAEHARRAGPYLLAGLCIGFTWWIKPHAILFVGTLGLFALISRSWRHDWLWVVLGASVMIGMELLLFQVMFGDPLHGLKAMASGVQTNFVRQSAPWGSHAPFYYFRLMFLDGRDMGLVPVFAALGLVVTLRRKDARGVRAAGFVVLWAIGLLAIFSFTPYSLSPFRLVPKQDNYALMFFGGIAMLAGFGLSSVRSNLLRWTAIVLLGTTSIALSSLSHLQQSNKQRALEVAMDYAQASQARVVYLPEQGIAVRRAHELMGIHELDGMRIEPLRTVLSNAARPLPSEPALAFLQANWPEVVRLKSLADAEHQLPCTQPVAELRVEATTFGTFVAKSIVAMSGFLPGPIARQFAFAGPLLNPPPVMAYQWTSEGCMP